MYECTFICFYSRKSNLLSYYSGKICKVHYENRYVIIQFHTLLFYVLQGYEYYFH